MFKKLFKKRKGFTLLEMIAVIFIIALLIIIFLPTLTQQRNQASQKVESAFRTTLQTQVDVYLDQEDIENKVPDNPKDVQWKDLKNADLLTDKQADKAEKSYSVNNKGQVISKTDTNAKN